MARSASARGCGPKPCWAANRAAAYSLRRLTAASISRHPTAAVAPRSGNGHCDADHQPGRQPPRRCQPRRHQAELGRGYTGTRMVDVAAAAGVAVQAVYWVFHTKPELLTACYDLAVQGDL